MDIERKITQDNPYIEIDYELLSSEDKAGI